jgi:NAD(P)-dependent dehydrogenase (short-subunit alcohol dehydrogenase family)
MNLILTDRTVLISASSKGIGFAIASQIASEGARVIVNGRSDNSVAGARIVASNSLAMALVNATGLARATEHTRRE